MGYTKSAIFTFFPTIFLHCLHNYNKHKSKQMESFTNVGTGNLKQIVFIKLLKNATLQLYKLKKCIVIICKIRSMDVMNNKILSMLHYVTWKSELTLLDIMIVSKALFDALMATFKVVAWSSIRMVCNITYPIVSRKWGKTPMWWRLRSLGSVAVQNKASIVSWPKAENKRSPTYKFFFKHYGKIQ